MEATIPHTRNSPIDTRFPRELRGVRVHMIGVGGSGMAGLAAMLVRHGAQVSGTDRTDSPALAALRGAGVSVALESQQAALPAADWVVMSAAIPPAHPERVEAAQRGVPVLKYAELLGELLARHEGIAIAGTHGKSTTTAWLAFALRQVGLDPSFVVGAEVSQLGGGSGVGAGRQFIAEACEFDRSFLNLRPRHAVILNIEEDHLDCYQNIAAIRGAFGEFAALVPPGGLLLLNSEDAHCHVAATSAAADVETFGLAEGATWRAADLSSAGGLYAFTLLHEGHGLGRFALGIAGRHNVMNALAVIALARRVGVRPDALAGPLRDFRGARRRLELRATVRGVHVADDYAHHPTEIAATLNAARERFAARRIWCVFQPHQHSRTRFLLTDFARSLRGAEHVIVPDIYFVRDSQRERESVSASDLVERICADGGDARHVADFGEIVTLLADSVQPGDVVLTMGAGDIWKVADELVRRVS